MCLCGSGSVSCVYHVHSSFGGVLNFAVWQFFVRLPTLNNANISMTCMATAAFCKIKVALTLIYPLITDQFTEYSTCQ